MLHQNNFFPLLVSEGFIIDSRTDPRSRISLPRLKKNLLHSLGLVYKSMRGMMTNSIDRDQWLNVTSESRDRI
jgi:hypothetical protein